MKPESEKDVTQTVRPPEYALPYINSGLQNINTLLQQGGAQQYGGPTVVPFSQQTNQALNMQTQRAMNGSPVVDAAQGFTTDLLGGNSPLAGMAEGGENPYLDATFDQAAGAVNRNLDTILARSGRDVNANMGARASQLNDLATDIYGGAYNADANRRLSAASTLGSQQLAAAGQAIPLANQDYFDIGQLRNVGGQVENLAGQYQQDAARRFQFEQNRPEAALDAYLARLAGQPVGQSSTQTMFRNPAAGALGGAASGAAAGSMFGPWGTLIGGGLGLLSGYYGG